MKSRFYKPVTKFDDKESSASDEERGQLEESILSLQKAGTPVPDSLTKRLSELESKASPNKFNAKKIIYNGIKYDSTREANFAKRLDQSGMKYMYQVEVELMPELTLESEKIRPIKIIVDFLVETDWFIDVKGITTQHFEDKWKLLKHKFQNSKKYIIARKESDFSSILLVIKNNAWKNDTLS